MPICLNNQGVRTPPERGPGKCVHTFRHDPFVKSRFWRQIFPLDRKGPPARLKPSTPRSANPYGPESTYVVPGEHPPMANPPPRPEKWRRRDPSGPLLRQARVTQKRGFCRRFDGIFPAVLPVVSRRFSGSFPTVFQRFYDSFASGLPAVLPTVFQQFSSGFPAVLPVVSQRFCQWSPSGFANGFASGLRRFCRRFSSGFPAVFSAGSTAVRQRFSGNTLPLDQPPAGSGLLLHPKETVGNSVHTFRRTNPA